VTVTWLLPAVAMTSETGSGHSRIKVSGASVGLPEPLGLGLALGRALAPGLGLVLGRAVELGLGLVLGRALELAGEGSVVVADAEGEAEELLEFADELVGEGVAFGAAEETSLPVADGDGAMPRSREASEALGPTSAALADD